MCQSTPSKSLRSLVGDDESTELRGSWQLVRWTDQAIGLSSKSLLEGERVGVVEGVSVRSSVVGGSS